LTNTRHQHRTQSQRLTCNPYDTARPRQLSAGSGAAVAANLAICALGTDTSGSVRFPSTANALVGMLATQGLVSRAGIIPLSFSRDRGGPMCRTVQDTAAVLEVVSGADPRDHVTAPAHGKKPVPYRQYANRKSLAGKRLGVVREFMIEASLADRDSIRIANQAVADLKRLGATIVDPVNFDGAIAEIMASYEPSFFTQTFKNAVPVGTDPIDRMVAITSDPKTLPTGVRGVNLRMIAGQRRGDEGKYAMNLYLFQRGDSQFRSVEDMFATKTFSGDLPVLQNAFGAKAKTLDTPSHSSHILRMQNLQRILYKVMADNNLDALVYPYSTIPPHMVLANRTPQVYNARTEPRILKAGTQLSDPNLLPGETTLKTDLDLWRGAGSSWSVNLSPVSGFPVVVVPAGFTREVYDRVPDAKDPNGSRLEGPKPDQIPVGMEFLGRPFDEATLLEIASAYEAGTKHRRPPKGFGPLKGEP
jgi:Asp-tRNA(Asn)/Glu-tRNA(Gln) amidotransferase A subunit family amidase